MSIFAARANGSEADRANGCPAEEPKCANESQQIIRGLMGPFAPRKWPIDTPPNKTAGFISFAVLLEY